MVQHGSSSSIMQCNAGGNVSILVNQHQTKQCDNYNIQLEKNSLTFHTVEIGVPSLHNSKPHHPVEVLDVPLLVSDLHPLCDVRSAHYTSSILHCPTGDGHAQVCPSLYECANIHQNTDCAKASISISSPKVLLPMQNCAKSYQTIFKEKVYQFNSNAKLLKEHHMQMSVKHQNLMLHITLTIHTKMNPV